MIDALRALFQKPVADARPDLVALLGPVDGLADGGVLVVDGSQSSEGDWVAALFTGATAVRQVSLGADAAGLPFDDGCPLAIPARDGGWNVVVLVDVIDRILDAAYALDALRAALAPGGRVLMVQAVSPDDPGARADWNVLGRMRDAAHTWTPTRRQVRAVPTGVGFDRAGEALWAETVELSCTRDETRESLALFAHDIDGRGLIVGGRLAVTRLALVMTIS